MKNEGLLDKKYSYIEYGAGKGRLSHQIAESYEGHGCHVLIEREGRKLKYDRFHRDNPFYFRLRLDI